MLVSMNVRTAWRSFTGIWERQEFRQYLHRRRYDSVNDWPFFRRAFLECWAEPGFHRFWRVWNPALGFLVFRFYRLIGGNRGGAANKILAFIASGFAHGLLVLPFLGWSWTIPVTFACFGLLDAFGGGLSRLIRQDRWIQPLNAVSNATLVVACFSIGFRVNDLICRL